MRGVVYNVDSSKITIPLNNTFNPYSSSYILCPNFAISGAFGPVTSFIINPDINLIKALKDSCIKTILDIKEKREELIKDGMAVANV